MVSYHVTVKSFELNLWFPVVNIKWNFVELVRKYCQYIWLTSTKKIDSSKLLLRVQVKWLCCAVACKYTHMAKHFCIHAYMWTWALCVCVWLMRIYKTSEQATCQLGTEHARCSCSSYFNVAVRHSSGSRYDKITVALHRRSAFFPRFIHHYSAD